MRGLLVLLSSRLLFLSPSSSHSRAEVYQQESLVLLLAECCLHQLQRASVPAEGADELFEKILSDPSPYRCEYGLSLRRQSSFARCFVVCVCVERERERNCKFNSYILLIASATRRFFRSARPTTTRRRNCASVAALAFSARRSTWPFSWTIARRSGKSSTRIPMSPIGRSSSASCEPPSLCSFARTNSLCIEWNRNQRCFKQLHLTLPAHPATRPCLTPSRTKRS